MAKARVKIDENGANPSGMILKIPNTGNAAALLLEWAACFLKSPVKRVYNHGSHLEVKLVKGHFYFDARNYINNNLPG